MRLSVIASASALIVASFATSAFAQETAPASDAPQSTAPKAESKGPRGFELGARLGFGLGLGKIGGDGYETMSNTVGSQVPLIVDVGYRITPNLYVGAYGQYGFGIVTSDKCKGDISCSAQSYRLGANVHYHFMPEGSFDPWIGAGTGFEWLHLSQSQGPASSSATLTGFEIVNFQVGGDYHLSPNASIGPFASFSLGQYGNLSADNGAGLTGSEEIKNTALHEWLTLGVKGTFDL